MQAIKKRGIPKDDGYDFGIRGRWKWGGKQFL